MANSRKRSIALLLSIIGGWLGLDRFYLGYTWTGLLKLLTIGCLGFWWLMDIFMILAGDLKPKIGVYAGKAPQPLPEEHREPETPAPELPARTRTTTPQRVIRRLRALPAARTTPILTKGEEPTIQSVRRRGQHEVRVKRKTRTRVSACQATSARKRSQKRTKQRKPAKKRAARKRR